MAQRQVQAAQVKQGGLPRGNSRDGPHADRNQSVNSAVGILRYCAAAEEDIVKSLILALLLLPSLLVAQSPSIPSNRP